MILLTSSAGSSISALKYSAATSAAIMPSKDAMCLLTIATERGGARLAESNRPVNVSCMLKAVLEMMLLWSSNKR